MKKNLISIAIAAIATIMMTASAYATMPGAIFYEEETTYVWLVPDAWSSNVPIMNEINALKNNIENFIVSPSKVPDVQIIYVPSGVSSYSGSSTPEKIRNCLKYHYTNNDLKAVQIWGTHALIPGIETATLFEDVTTDFFYSALDGNLVDIYNDGNYGDFWDASMGSVDLEPDVTVARAPVDTYAELDSFIGEVFGQRAYGQKEKMLATESLSTTSFDFYEGSIPTNIEIDFITQDNSSDSYLDELEDALELDGANEYGLFSTADNGDNDYIQCGTSTDIFETSDLGTTYDLKGAIGIMANSYSGSFDDSTGCFNEKLVSMADHGAVFVAGNSAMGPTVYTEKIFIPEFWENVFSDDYVTYAEAHLAAKQALTATPTITVDGNVVNLVVNGKAVAPVHHLLLANNILGFGEIKIVFP